MKKRNVAFKVGEDTLRGTLFIPDGKGPFPGVLFYHGSGSKGEKYYRAGEKFAKEGITALAFNFRGCGKSEGGYSSQTYQDAFDDALKAYDFLLSQKYVDTARIGACGGSFGGFVVSMVLPQLKIKSLVLLSPSAHKGLLSTKIDMGSLEREVKYFAVRSNWESSESFKNIAEFKGQLLIIKSENDENIPPEVPDKYYREASQVLRKEMKVIEGADHRLSKEIWEDEFKEIASEWFLETL